MSGTAPNMNYGGSPNLVLNSSSSSGLVEFSLANLPPQTGSKQIAKATLTVFVDSVRAAGSLTAQPLAAAGFNESTVTYKTHPSLTDIGDTVPIPVNTANTFLTVVFPLPVENGLRWAVLFLYL